MNHPRSGTHLQWRKSSYSSETANCVEVALSSALVGVRDSKNPEGATLVYSAGSWGDFVSAVRGGEFDRPTAKR